MQIGLYLIIHSNLGPLDHKLGIEMCTESLRLELSHLIWALGFHRSTSKLVRERLICLIDGKARPSGAVGFKLNYGL